MAGVEPGFHSFLPLAMVFEPARRPVNSQKSPPAGIRQAPGYGGSGPQAEVVVYFDGLCEPRNPGGVAAYGFLAYSGGEKLVERWGVVGEGVGMTNNVAEYYALCEALAWLLEHGYRTAKVTVRGDSQLVINQLTGWWNVNGGMYYRYYERAKSYLDVFPSIRFEWVPREKNAEADRLTKRAYEEYCEAMGRPVEYMHRR